MSCSGITPDGAMCHSIDSERSDVQADNHKIVRKEWLAAKRAAQRRRPRPKESSVIFGARFQAERAFVDCIDKSVSISRSHRVEPDDAPSDRIRGEVEFDQSV